MGEKLTIFEDLEDDKENYTVQRQGRSASLISRLMHTSEESKDVLKEDIWREILDKAHSVEDPLQLFIDYIEFESHQVKGDWTSRRSKLLDVNELCLLYCKQMDKYKNNVKFLNVWLDYCTNFYSNEEQIDVLVYMYRSNIANQLADFYSYFIDILVLLERYQEAYQVVKLGIKTGAKPEKQLKDELELLEKDYPQEIQGDAVTDETEFGLDQIVTRYNEPNLVLNHDINTLITEYHARGQNGSVSASSLKSSSNPTIYMDDIDSDSEGNKSNIKDKLILKLTDNELKFQSKREKLKENMPIITGKFEPDTNITPLLQVDTTLTEPNAKLSIFDDNLGKNGAIFKMIYITGLKPEKIDCNFDLIYPQDGVEFSIEELLAQSRGSRRRISPTSHSNKRVKL